MATLPQGTVTLVFTDIEGSTRLLSSLGSRYEAVLADHRQLLRDAFRSHGGVPSSRCGLHDAACRRSVHRQPPKLAKRRCSRQADLLELQNRRLPPAGRGN